MISQTVLSDKRQSCRGALFTDCSSNPDSKPTSQDQAKQAKAVIQLDIFDIALPPELGIKRVPRKLAITPNRFYLEVRHYERCWYYPLQFSEVEAHWIYPKVKDLDWSLNTEGIPVESALIYQTVELLIDGGVRA